MPDPLRQQRFGAHLSVAGGLHKAFDEAVRVGCDCLAIFVKNQRQWKGPPLAREQVRLFREAQARTKVGPVAAHASYLLNLASPNEAGRRKSIAALVDELERCEALGVPYLVVHPGSHLGDGVDAGIGRIVASLDEVLEATRGFASMVLLENTAGQGNAMGRAIEQFGRILPMVREPQRVGVCLDTCHLFAAGYDLRDAAAYERMVQEVIRHVGLDRVQCIHVNDSKGPLGSRLDRHEHIGKGLIGRSGFVHLVNDVRLAGVPKILETPKGVDGRGRDLDRVNLGRLRAMIER